MLKAFTPLYLWLALAPLSVDHLHELSATILLSSQLSSMIDQLESNNPETIQDFLVTYAHPTDLKALLRNATLEELVAGFMGKKQEDLKRALSHFAPGTKWEEDGWMDGRVDEGMRSRRSIGHGAGSKREEDG